MSRSAIAGERLAVSPGAVISEDHAVELLPGAGGKAARRRWLRDRGITRQVLGKLVVRWVDVLEALGECPPVDLDGAPIPNRPQAPAPRPDTVHRTHALGRRR